MRTAVFSIALLLSGAARATTLGELLKAAEDYNVDQRISRVQRERAATELQAAWSSLTPSVTAQATWTNNQYPVEIALGPGAPPITITPANQFDGVLRFELPLIDTQRWFRISTADSASESAEHRYEQTRDGVILQVSTTYYSYAAALAVRESAQRSLGVAEAQLKLQEIRFSAGSITELELLRARAEVQRNKQLVADSLALVANTRRALRTLTGGELQDDALLPEDDLQPVAALSDVEGRTAENPAVKAAESDARTAERLARSAKFALVPQLTANFTERFTNATGFAGNAALYTAGIGLVWRLDATTFFNMKLQSQQADIAQLGIERQTLATRDRIHSDWQRLNTAIEKVGSAKSQVEAATRAAKIARDRYDAGAATQIDVIQAERDLFGSEVNLIQARTELASSHVSLRVSAKLPLDID